MNIAEQIQQKRAQIGQIESKISSCQRGLNYFSISEDRTIFIRYQSTDNWQSGTVLMSADVAQKAINMELRLLQIEIEQAEQELQNLIKTNQE